LIYQAHRKEKIFFVDQEYLKESGKFNKIIRSENIIVKKIYGCFEKIEVRF
jgi:hypothetical protein